MIKPAIQGVLNVLKACAKAGKVKRVILTSSAAAVSINQLNGTGIVVDESHWTDVEFLSSAKPPTWVTLKFLFVLLIFRFSRKKFLSYPNGSTMKLLVLQGYPVSKTLAEKTAWKFAEENNIDLVTVIPSLMAGPSPTIDVPSSIGLAMSLITGNLANFNLS